ncbi:MAG: aldo/keto reductase family protein, partial [Planctomycetes bacterium]|nr:aldo/keto reductase family protein [Planctomycetota bacterium]
SLGGWLTIGASVNEESSAAIVRTAVDAGINFIDLADAYAKGGAEQTIGRILGQYRRSDLVISSKLFWPMSDNPNDKGLSRKHIMESIDRTLKNLGTDYLDIYFCHREDPETTLSETTRAMDDLVHRGKILYWGTSVWRPRTLRDVHAICDRRGLYRPIVEQPPYNLLERSIERKVLPAARNLGMGVVVWSPLAGGILTGKYLGGVPAGSRGATTRWLDEYLAPANTERVRRFVEIARRAGNEPAQLALAWILSQDGITSVITGATNPEQLKSNLKALEAPLSSDLKYEIEQIFPA